MREWAYVGAGTTGAIAGQLGISRNGGGTMVKPQTPAELFAKYPWLHWVITLATLAGQVVALAIESFLGMGIWILLILPAALPSFHLSPVVSWSFIVISLGTMALLNTCFSELNEVRKVHGQHFKKRKNKG